LARRDRILEIIEAEVTQLKQPTQPHGERYEPGEGEFDDADLIANEKALILLTEQGYIKRMPVNTLRRKVGHRGKKQLPV